MKKLIILLLTIVLPTLVKAQSYTTVDLFNSGHINEGGYYYKDIIGYLNQYKGGTWQYTAPNLTIQLRFDVKTFVDVDYKDVAYKREILVGGIRIVKNGVEVVNTLADVSQNKPSSLDYLISSITRIKNHSNCYKCTTNKQRLSMHYKEPNNDNIAFETMDFDMHVYKNSQNQSILRLVFSEVVLNRDPNWYDPEYEDAPTKTSLFLPFGTFDFVKLP